ncbi:triphosphoribosyl-dephospho-CoA synthase [Anaerobacillus sp. MEB173]|uniref:triphosphoribosyl-dephospho-CoA synthase n=1 Tax=Anaerobacillus sp. MEB173 TaxID=3383345 RepID=UPI003F932072
MAYEKYTFSCVAAITAVTSLIEEVELTPKPGLVDMENTGAHDDLTIELMKKSAESLKETFAEIAFISYGRKPSQSIREAIAEIGRRGEAKMFKATGGVNTHKGAIWAIGLLVSAYSMGKGTYLIEEIVSKAGEIARFPDRFFESTVTNGGRVVAKYGVPGARGEAQQGFPHIMKYSLPTLNQMRMNGASDSEAQLYALLSLILNLDDTCILHRGGPQALMFAKDQAKMMLTEGHLGWLTTLDEEFTKRNISPGGSADLLAATIFLDKTQTLKTLNDFQKEVEYIQ